MNSLYVESSLLLRQTFGIFKKWKQYHCVLNEEVLTWISDKGSVSSDKGNHIDLKTIHSARKIVVNGREYAFELCTREKTFAFSAESPELQTKWVDALQRVIQINQRELKHSCSCDVRSPEYAELEDPKQATSSQHNGKPYRPRSRSLTYDYTEPIYAEPGSSESPYAEVRDIDRRNTTAKHFTFSKISEDAENDSVYYDEDTEEQEAEIEMRRFRTNRSSSFPNSISLTSQNFVQCPVSKDFVDYATVAKAGMKKCEFSSECPGPNDKEKMKSKIENVLMELDRLKYKTREWREIPEVQYSDAMLNLKEFTSTDMIRKKRSSGERALENGKYIKQIRELLINYEANKIG